jgi:calcineurin-like phosphoesterase family protein
MSLKNPARVLDLREICRGKRVIYVGDPHGCYDEVQELLKLFDWKMSADILVFHGDLVDRGPKVYEMVNFVRYIDNIYCCEGNHENRIKRWLWGRNVHIGKTHQRTIDCFDFELGCPRRKKELTEWFESLPQMIRTHDDIYAVHAGINPIMPITAQTADDCLWKRYADAAGNMHWWCWNRGPDAPWILFGHNVQFTHDVGGRAYALDGGCVYGGELRGMEVLADGTFGRVMSVPAKQVYYEPRRIEHEEGYLHERVKKGEAP